MELFSGSEKDFEKEVQRKKKEDAKRLKLHNKKLSKYHKRLLKKAKVYKLTDQAQINAGILKYAKNNVIMPGSLSEEQRNDPAFMLEFLKTKKQHISFFEPVPSSQLRKNYDYMIEYIKIKRATGYQYDFTYLMKGYEDLLKDVEFLKKLHFAFPNENLVATVYKNLSNSLITTKQKEVKKLIMSIPSYILLKQAKQHGSEFLRYMPKEHGSYIVFAEEAISCDGFKALKKTDLNTIKDYPHLIYRAIDKDGCAPLQDFLIDHLNPERTYWIVDDDYKEFDSNRLELQKELLKDNIFWGHISKMKGFDPAVKEILAKKVECGEAYLTYQKKCSEASETYRKIKNSRATASKEMNK